MWSCLSSLSLHHVPSASRVPFCLIHVSRDLTFDVAVVGGGIMGLSSAYFLAHRMPGIKICVVERDPSYKQASTTLSVASIRQQFSTPENILLSQYSHKFLTEADKKLCVDDQDPPNILLKEQGYLITSSSNEVKTLLENHEIQKQHGCHVALLTPEKLKPMFPWLNTDGLSMASLGTAKEGWFDQWALLSAFKLKVLSLGVQYIHGNVVGITTDQDGQVASVEIAPASQPESTQTVACGAVVNAAGPHARSVAEMLNISLPVESRKRCVFVLSCREGPPHDQMPLLVDCSGFYVRPETGGVYVCGMPPSEDKETDDLEVDYDIFDNIWPLLANRIPAFEETKVQGAWAGFNEYNTLDQNSIIGRHPVVKNFIFINGFSGHGVQQSPAAGRAVSEIILDGRFQTIDLSRFGYERVLSNSPLKETITFCSRSPVTRTLKETKNSSS